MLGSAIKCWNFANINSVPPHPSCEQRERYFWVCPRLRFRLQNWQESFLLQFPVSCQHEALRCNCHRCCTGVASCGSSPAYSSSQLVVYYPTFWYYDKTKLSANIETDWWCHSNYHIPFGWLGSVRTIQCRGLLFCQPGNHWICPGMQCGQLPWSWGGWYYNSLYLQRVSQSHVNKNIIRKRR